LKGIYYEITGEIMEGRKFDTDKPQIGLIPSESIFAVARVMTYGAKKYAKDNWLHVPDAEQRYFDAALRHVLQYNTGNKTDEETGENHLAHAICCLMFLLYADETGHAFPTKP